MNTITRSSALFFCRAILPILCLGSVQADSDATKGNFECGNTFTVYAGPSARSYEFVPGSNSVREIARFEAAAGRYLRNAIYDCNNESIVGFWSARGGPSGFTTSSPKNASAPITVELATILNAGFVVGGNLFVMGGALVQARPLPKSEVTDKNRDIQADRLNQLRPWKELGSTDHRMLGMVDFFRFDAKTGQRLSVEPIKYPTSTYIRLVGESSILIGVNPPIWFDFDRNLVERRFAIEVKKLPYKRAKVWQYSGDTMYYVSNVRSGDNSSDAIFKLKEGSSTEWVRIQEVSFPIEFHHFDAGKIVVAGPGHIGLLRTDSDSWTEISLKETKLVPFASASLESAHLMLFSLPVEGQYGQYAATYIKVLSKDLSTVYAEQLLSWIRASPKLSSQKTQNKREYGRF